MVQSYSGPWRREGYPSLKPVELLGITQQLCPGHNQPQLIITLAVFTQK